MTRIEFIRPRGELTGDLAETPLWELLIGILKGNLSGRLDLDGAHAVWFRDGIPIRVDAAPSERLPPPPAWAEAELDRLRQADRRGTSPFELRVRRAKDDLARLFRLRAGPFRFGEGSAPGDGGPRLVLEPLPVLYAGLVGAAGSPAALAILGAGRGMRYRLLESYPAFVDPFEWGEEVEAEVARLDVPRPIEALGALGLERAAAVVAALKIAGMVEETEPATEEVPALPAKAPSPRAPGSGPDLGAPPTAARAGAERPPGSGLRPSPLRKESPPPEADAGEGLRPLMIPRLPVAAPKPAAPMAEPRHLTEHARDVELLTRALRPFREKTYFDVLRQPSSASSAQLERAYRHLAQKGEAGLEARVLKDLYDEAYRALANDKILSRYRRAVERGAKGEADRKAMEVEPKLARILDALARDATAEAQALIDWVEALDPKRRELEVPRAYVQFALALGAERDAAAERVRAAISDLVRRGQVPMFHVFHGLLASALVALGERERARDALRSLGPDSPLYDRLRALLEG